MSTSSLSFRPAGRRYAFRNDDRPFLASRHQLPYVLMMRTTLTLEDDVAAALQRWQQKEKITLKEAVNRGLRLGLARESDPPSKRRKVYTHPVSGGGCRLPSIDDISAVLSLGEGEHHR